MLPSLSITTLGKKTPGTRTFARIWTILRQLGPMSADTIMTRDTNITSQRCAPVETKKTTYSGGIKIKFSH